MAMVWNTFILGSQKESLYADAPKASYLGRAPLVGALRFSGFKFPRGGHRGRSNSPTLATGRSNFR